MEFKAATLSDLEFLERVESECFSDPWNKEMLVSELLDRSAHFYIMLEDGVPLGYYSFLHVLDEAHIMNVAVLPEYQGKGYGRAEMENLLSTTKEAGALNVTLEVRKSNVKAISLYESLGFSFVGTRPKYYMDGEDALIYWLYRS